MNKLLVALTAGFILSGCTSSTEYGRCVGLGDKQSSKLEYEVSTRNVVLAVIFSETIFTPVIVLVKETYCPIGPKSLEE